MCDCSIKSFATMSNRSDNTKFVLIAVITTRICTIISIHAVHSREKTTVKDVTVHGLTLKRQPWKTLNPPLEEPLERGSEPEVLHPCSTFRSGRRYRSRQLPRRRADPSGLTLTCPGPPTKAHRGWISSAFNNMFMSSPSPGILTKGEFPCMPLVHYTLVGQRTNAHEIW